MDPFDVTLEMKSEMDESQDIENHNANVLSRFRTSSPPLRKSQQRISESALLAHQKEVQKERIIQLRREKGQINKSLMEEYRKNPDLQRKVNENGLEGVGIINQDKWVTVTNSLVLEKLINLHDKDSDDPFDVVTLLELDKLKSRLFGTTWFNVAGTKKRRNKSNNKSKNKKKRMTRNRRN
jgi:hypothetical protein